MVFGGIKFGEDIFGNDYVEHLKKSNINTDKVFRTNMASTGVAPILVDENGAASNFSLSVFLYNFVVYK